MSDIPNDRELNEILESLSIYYTSRIAIKNYGNKNNSIEIIDTSDLSAEISFPEWIKDNNGNGAIIHSSNLVIDLKIKCINDGKLGIYLRGLDIRDKKNTKFPVYIDYTSLIINGKEQITENKLTWADEPLVISRQVKNNELITLHIEWKPFNSLSLYENRIVKNLEKQLEKLISENKKQKEEIENLKFENKKFKSKLNKISNSSILEIRKIKKEL